MFRLAAIAFLVVPAAELVAAYLGPRMPIDYRGLWVTTAVGLIGALVTWALPWHRIALNRYMWVVIPGIGALTLSLFLTGGTQSPVLIVFPLLVVFMATLLELRFTVIAGALALIGSSLPLLQGWDWSYARKLVMLAVLLALFASIPDRLRRALTRETELAERRRDELEGSYVATIGALASALDAKDRYTEAHSRETAALAVAVGRRLGLDAERLRFLEYAAYLHDIGKIGMPGHLLNKPGPLTSDEMQIMKEHPVIGERIIASVPFLAPVRRVVRAEHERWDGTGYPDGLKGEEIPIEARIIHACDAFHAMASDRPYRQALARPAILRELRSQAGQQFDPVVAQTLLEVLASEEVSVTDHTDMGEVAPMITWTGPRSWAQHLEAIETLSARLGRITAVPEICRLIGETVVTLVPYDHCRINLLEDDERTLTCVWLGSTNREEYAGATAANLSVQVGEGITGWVAETKRGVVLGDSERHAKARHVPETPITEESMLAVPIVFEEQLLGVLVVVMIGLHQYTPDHLRLLTILANQAAVSIANARLIQRLASAARVDPLTGVGNRRAFEDALRKKLAAPEGGFAIAMFDVDQLKQTNDAGGHSAGDALLRRVAAALTAQARPGDVAARWGGDEFLALLNGCTRGEAEVFGTRIFESLQIPSALGPAASVSVGVAEYPTDGTTLDQLLDAADRSMYGAKRQRAA
jgi:diguanylate cyclase (GGDEF)-like protein